MSVRKDSVINLAGSVAPILVMLVTVPLYLEVLGVARYGVLAIVWLFVGYFSFLDLGLGKATVNHISRLGDAPNSERTSVFWTALATNSILGLIAACILWIVSNLLLESTALGIPEELREEVVASVPWVVSTLPIAMVSGVLTGALEGRSQFLVVNMLQLTGTIVFQVVPLLVAYMFGASLAIIIPVAVVSRALMNVPLLIACFKYVPLTAKVAFSLTSAKSLFRFGGWIAISGIVGPVLETADRFAIGFLLGVQAVTYYTIPYQLVTKLRVVPSSIARALFPRYSADSFVIAQALSLVALRALLIVMTPTVIVAVLLLRPLMSIWVGEPVSNAAAPLGEILLLGVWVSTLAYVPYTLLQGRNRPDVVAKIHLLELLPFLGILWIAMNQWGIVGAAWAWTLRATADFALLFARSQLGMRSLGVVVAPAFMVVLAVLAASYIAALFWFWRFAALVLFLGVTCWWLAGRDNRTAIAKVFGRLSQNLPLTGSTHP